ncbi:hypothetical protein FIV45_12300 [Paremcibacter congregatus]|nr:hypothetical protein FIV45_12300 [Paremcibacter congregatus]
MLVLAIYVQCHNALTHYLERMELYAGQHRRKWGVENNGLCLLLVWTNEIIQRGTGWYPSDQ